MNIKTILILSLTLMACSPEVHYQIVAHNCTQAQEANGVRITCPDGSSTFVANGTNGNDGQSITGPQGPAGPGGSSGVNGSNGHSALITSIVGPSDTSTRHCTLILGGTDWNDNSILSAGEVTMQTETCDGTPAPAFTPVSYVDFCSPARNWSEVGIKIGNVIIASMSSNDQGDLTRFVKIIPASYRTTDGYSCNFSVLADGTVVH